MPLTADRPDVRPCKPWRFASRDRLRAARFEETRRMLEINDERIVCDIESTDPDFAAGRRIAVPAGLFEVRPVRFESQVASDDGQSKLAWSNVETLHFAPQAGLFVRYEQRVAGPDGNPAREVLLQMQRHEQPQ